MDLPQLIKINDKIIPIAKKTPFNERFGSWIINLRFLIRCLLGNRIYISNAKPLNEKINILSHNKCNYELLHYGLWQTP